MDAKAIFDSLKSAINEACENEASLEITELAFKHSMIGGEEPYGAVGQKFVFSKTFPDGSKIDMEYKWYDTSKTFSIQPDINKYSLAYTDASGKKTTHSNSYYDKF